MIRRAAWFADAVFALAIVVAVVFGWTLLPSIFFATPVVLIAWEHYDVWMLERAERKRR